MATWLPGSTGQSSSQTGSGGSVGGNYKDAGPSGAVYTSSSAGKTGSNGNGSGDGINRSIYNLSSPGVSGGGGGGGGGPKSGVSAADLLDQNAFGGAGNGNTPSGTGAGDGTTPANGAGTGDGTTPATGTGGTTGTGAGNNGSAYQYLGTGAAGSHTLPELDGPNPERVNHVDTETLRGMLQQLVDLQTEQSNKQIDYSVERGTNELNRAMEDAAKQYQTQRDQASADEAQALDNQALYAEARGDRGGIGQAQYASIQNTAAQNRRAVNDAQVKLGTDTARQIADLRAQGEFQKADQLLSITQSHLAQLKDLEQWALGTNLGVDEFNSQLQQWVDEYNLKKQQYLADLDLSTAQVTGMFSDGTKTMQYQNALVQSLATSGNALLQSGVMPSRQQLEAMGMTELQAKAYFNARGIKY